MTHTVEHLSDLVNDELCAGLPPREGVEVHLARCAECREALDAARAAHDRFLARYPALETLPARRKSPAVREEDPGAGWLDWLRASRSTRRFTWGLGLAAATAVAILMVPRFQPLPPETGIRLKGGSSVELFVARGDRSQLFSGQPLRAGDRLAIRYSTEHRYLMLVSVEASGKISVLLPADGEASMPIEPGHARRLDDGVELDAYPGPERWVALLTDQPLTRADVVRTLSAAMLDAGGTTRLTAALEPLPFAGEQLSWLLTKEAP
ncbi:MAG: hypothetical protein HY903_17325 [Deltaproteobacteria bacterium]|nr:hypothetical protein [Deltaproteobacteria bacterium]